MEVTLESIRQCIESSGGGARRVFIRSLERRLVSLEGPDETLHRYAHTASAIRIGLDLHIFAQLVEAGAPVALQTLSAGSGADRGLLARLLRYLAAIDVIDEISPNKYAANGTTRNLADGVVAAGLKHFLYTVGPQYDALPAFLKRTKHQTPLDGQHTAFQDAWKTPLHSFKWFSENPEHLQYFNDYMSLRREPELSWLSVYPVQSEVANWSADSGDAALYVNMGGGIGHQCKQFREKYPDLPGRIILQDLPHSIAEALPTRGVQNMEHDFFAPQPITNAKFYHLRGVLHDHPPHRVHEILDRIAAAMGPHSVLLIDEMILPEQGVDKMASAIDLAMLTALAGMERTQAQWRETFERAGLELVETFIYAPLHYEGVMHVRLPGTR